VLFELLTGEPPFTGDTPVAVAYQHVREDPRRRRRSTAGPPALDAIVLKALSKNPANRYQSAAEMRADLVRVRVRAAAARADRDERGRAHGDDGRRPAHRRHPAPQRPQGCPRPPEPDYGEYYADEEPPRRTGRVVAIVLGVLVVLGLVGFVAYQLLSGPPRVAGRGAGRGRAEPAGRVQPAHRGRPARRQRRAGRSPRSSRSAR
jgi:serine/threonine-protein kinase